MKKAVKIPLLLILILILGAAAFIGFLTLVEYRPADQEKVSTELWIEDNGSTRTISSLPSNKEFSIITWNVGYCSLGSNADFFMDGGKMVNTADKERVDLNLNKIIKKLQAENPDFIFLQEVDVKSKRSHRTNEKVAFQENFKDYESAFATNFKVPFIPYPLPPIGKVYSGIQTLSQYDISEASRIALPTSFKWPYRLGNLKRCLLITRLPIDGMNKELVLINLHLEAYDSGEGKIMQTKVFKSVLEEEIEKGNYVIAGGDFNQQFSSTDASSYPILSSDYWAPGIINESDFDSSLKFYQPSQVPSCRSLDKAYEGQSAENFQFYFIDGFIVSENVKVTSAATIDMNFENTDHNPIRLTFTLN